MSSQRSEDDQRPKTVVQQLAPYMALGTQLAVSVLFLGGIGWLIDAQAGSTPWGLVVGLCLGSVVGFVQFLRSVQRMLELDEQRKQEGRKNGWAKKDPL
jgi:ATP synthase protein I